jgi:N-methylhydantoinase B
LSGGAFQRALFDGLLSRTRSPIESEGDFSAQLAANRAGVAGLSALVEQYGPAGFESGTAELNAYAGRLARAAMRRIPDGVYTFEDCLDDDGQGNRDIPIRLALRVHDGLIEADFSATAAQVSGTVNCPLSVTAAGVFYAFRCLMPVQTPACAGAFEGIRLKVPAASLLNAVRPAAVAAGNVETSSRVVDVVLGALAQAIPGLIPAASHGSMNNLAVGSGDPAHAWDYYETMGGGMGAGRDGGGLSALQTHMTNTLNTPVEVLESRYPLRVTQYRIRRGSGGAGERRGGDGLVREFEFLAPAHFTLLTERRRHAPWPVGGAAPGSPGRNLLNGRVLGAKCEGDVQAGDRLCVETPGGGGWSSETTGDD